MNENGGGGGVFVVLLVKVNKKMSMYVLFHLNVLGTSGSNGRNGFDVLHCTTVACPPIATPTVVGRHLFFRQGGDQMNGGGLGPVDIQPIRLLLPFGTIVVHRRLGTDQRDGPTIDGIHPTLLAVPHVHVGTPALAGDARRVHAVTALFHHHRLHRKGRLANDPAATVRLTECQVLHVYGTV